VGRVGKFALFYLINKNNLMEKDSFAALIAAAQNMRDSQKEYFRAAKKNSSDKKEVLNVAKVKELEFEQIINNITNSIYINWRWGKTFAIELIQMGRELMALQRKAFDALRIKDYSARLLMR
jgi:hypothetical protein